jgi:hypothetical protein
VSKGHDEPATGREEAAPAATLIAETVNVTNHQAGKLSKHSPPIWHLSTLVRQPQGQSQPPWGVMRSCDERLLTDPLQPCPGRPPTSYNNTRWCRWACRFLDTPDAHQHPVCDAHGYTRRPTLPSGPNHLLARRGAWDASFHNKVPFHLGPRSGAVNWTHHHQHLTLSTFIDMDPQHPRPGAGTPCTANDMATAANDPGGQVTLPPKASVFMSFLLAKTFCPTLPRASSPAVARNSQPRRVERVA